MNTSAKEVKTWNKKKLTYPNNRRLWNTYSWLHSQWWKPKCFPSPLVQWLLPVIQFPLGPKTETQKQAPAWKGTWKGQYYLLVLSEYVHLTTEISRLASYHLLQSVNIYQITQGIVSAVKRNIMCWAAWESTKPKSPGVQEALLDS